MYKWIRKENWYFQNNTRTISLKGNLKTKKKSDAAQESDSRKDWMKSLRETRKRITLFYTFYMVTVEAETITSQIEILNTHASSPIGATVHNSLT